MAPTERRAAYSARLPGRSRGADARHPAHAEPRTDRHQQRLGVPALAAHHAWGRPDGLGGHCSASRSTGQGEFRAAVVAFSRLPDEPLQLARHGGPQGAGTAWADGERVVLDRDSLRQPAPILSWKPARGDRIASAPGWPAGEDWRAGPARRGCCATQPPLAAGPSLIRPLAEVLLHADLRPDDRLLVIGASMALARRRCWKAPR